MNFKTEIANAISKVLDIDVVEIENLIEVPSNSEMGDYAFPCFRFAKEFKKAPNIIAQEIASKIQKNEVIKEIKTVNAYINFYISKEVFVKEVVSEVLSKKEDYGKSEIGKGKTVVIDYSSPNIAKPFHIGHLRSTVIGNSLYNIFKTLGYKTIGINYLGDWGTQFGKLIVAYKKWGDKEAVEKEDIKELSRIYVKFHDEAEKDKSLEDEARTWLVKMQNGDEEALSLWKWFCELSMKEFKRVYDKLGIEFDYYTGESFYNDKMQPVVEEIKEKNLLVESQGAKIVDLEEYKMPPCLILRKDGGTLYPTRDISAAIHRKNEYDFYKCLYVTAMDQNLHFAQWFKVIELMGYPWSKDLVHIPFGLVSLADGKLSTRKGRVGLLMEEILDLAVEKSLNIIEERNSSLSDKEKVARQVGIGAIIFNDLYNSRIKNVVFELDRMLNFEGETGPYVQYTHARACSILRKENIGQDYDFSNVEFSGISDDASFNVCKVLSQYTDKLIDASIKYEPYIFTRFIIDLCQEFNKFYNENRINTAEDEIKTARLALVYCVKTVINTSLKILGIDSPEEM